MGLIRVIIGIMTTPYFLWDYPLSEAQVNEILKGKDEVKKRWIATRILESARLDDVFKYLTLSEIKQLFPYLKMKKSVKKAWERALNAWSLGK